MGSKINTKLNIAWNRQKTPREAHLGQILGPCWTKLGPKLDQVGAKLGQAPHSSGLLPRALPSLNVCIKVG